MRPRERLLALAALAAVAVHPLASNAPRGAVGVLLAGTWAVMLGMLRRHARGLFAPILAHVVADATIAVIVLRYVR